MEDVAFDKLEIEFLDDENKKRRSQDPAQSVRFGIPDRQKGTRKHGEEQDHLSGNECGYQTPRWLGRCRSAEAGTRSRNR